MFEPGISKVQKKSANQDAGYEYSDFFFFYSGLSGYWHCGHSWPIVPASGDSEYDCGEADGM
jgi:hypothetical protein